jgi:hypothetical protein
LRKRNNQNSEDTIVQEAWSPSNAPKNFASALQTLPEKRIPKVKPIQEDEDDE